MDFFHESHWTDCADGHKHRQRASMCSFFGKPAESDEGVYTALVLHSVSGHTHHLTGCGKHLRITAPPLCAI